MPTQIEFPLRRDVADAHLQRRQFQIGEYISILNFQVVFSYFLYE
jgi:hypothetical protein